MKGLNQNLTPILIHNNDKELAIRTIYYKGQNQNITTISSLHIQSLSLRFVKRVRKQKCAPESFAFTLEHRSMNLVKMMIVPKQ